MNRKPDSRAGGLAVVMAVLVLLALTAVGFMFFSGSKTQSQQTELLAEGYDLFNKGQLESAYEQFKKAGQIDSASLQFYRKAASPEGYLTPAEMSELLISICLSVAYDSFFALEANEDWTKKAEQELQNITAEDRKQELSALIATAKEVSGLCKNFAEGEVESALKELLEVEKRALASDQDFFLFEIRMLIAGGKELNEPDIIAQARELLFFATTDAGINNDKTSKLWMLLTN